MKDASWDDLQLFFHVATGGGLSAAAGRTGLSAPTIGRRMLALERVTGRSLFSRGPTGYLLAKDGQELLDRVRLMQDAARAISDWRGEVLTLPIVSTAADSWTSRFVADHLANVWTPKDSFRMCYKTCDTSVDFTYREAHIAIRHSRPESGNVAIRRSVKVAHAAYQAAGYDEKTVTGSHSAPIPPSRRRTNGRSNSRIPGSPVGRTRRTCCFTSSAAVPAAACSPVSSAIRNAGSSAPGPSSTN